MTLNKSQCIAVVVFRRFTKTRFFKNCKLKPDKNCLSHDIWHQDNSYKLAQFHVIRLLLSWMLCLLNVYYNSKLLFHYPLALMILNFTSLNIWKG